MAQSRSTKSKQETAAEQGLEDAQTNIPAPISDEGFAVDVDSPFPDGYSIEGETRALEPSMVDGVVPEGDPFRDRFLQLLERKKLLSEMESSDSADEGGSEAARDEGESTVRPARIVKSADAVNMGRLVDEGVDQMTLHTRQAYHLFMGRQADPAKNLYFIPGGRHVASALRLLWQMTRNDNPYADWALLRHEQLIGQIHKRLEAATVGALKNIEQAGERGLKFSILESASPVTLELGFRSPYGYAVAELITAYDYYVRLEKTLARKNLQSDKQVRNAIADITRRTRGIFNETSRFGRWLTNKEIQGLSRADFVPEAAEDARNRVRFVSGVFGMVPAEIFTGELQPRHSLRWNRLSQKEQDFLEQIAAQNEQEPEAALI